MSDWRITNQHRYLDDVDLVWDKFQKHGLTDHVHCEFCMVKFPQEVEFGYRTIDSKHWICKECYEDFKNEFHWRLLSPMLKGDV